MTQLESHLNQGINTEFKLPMLDAVKQDMISRGLGQISCGAPVNHEHVQVGFKGRPESFTRLSIEDTGTGLVVSFDTPMAIEGPVIDRSGNKPRVGRHITPVISSIELIKTDGGWVSSTIGAEGEPVVLGRDDHLVLARTLAKLGDNAQRKVIRKVT